MTIFASIRVSRSVRAASRLLGTLTCCALFAPLAVAGSYKVYGPYYAWVNNFNDPKNIMQPIETRKSRGAHLDVSFDYQEPSLYGYPAIVRGSHYGWNPTSDTLFPRRFSEFRTIPVQFSYRDSGTNLAGDFAYDLFFRHDLTSKNPQLEVMVWGNHNSWPLGRELAKNVITQGRVSYDLWGGYNSGAGYYTYTFVPSGTVGRSTTLAQSGQLNLDLKPFLTWLAQHPMDNGGFDQAMILDVVEAGFEVVRGHGQVSMTASINAR